MLHISAVANLISHFKYSTCTYKQVIALALFAAVSNAQHLEGVKDCGTTMTEIRHVIVSGCIQTPCRFVPGDTYRLQMSAFALVSSNSLNYALTADFFGLDFPLTDGNACNNLIDGASCPVQIGNTYTYFLDYTVPTLFPPNMNTYVQLAVQHHSGQVGICIQVAVQT